MVQNSEFDQAQSTPQTTPQTDAEAELPQPNERGEYQRTSHRYWEAANSDPNGVKCRMGPHSIQEIEDPGSKV